MTRVREVIGVAVVWDDIGGLIDAHRRFLAGEPMGDETNLRDAILTSWRRCKAAGVVPGRVRLPESDAEPRFDEEDRLLRAAAPVIDRLASVLSSANVSVLLCDAEARVLRRLGGDAGLDRHLDAVSLAPGFAFTEDVAGTNGIGTALAERRPAYVSGREHFADCMQPFACAGAPIRHPLSGRVEGVLDLTCYRTDADPAMLTLVEQAVASIERRLLEQTTARERELLAAALRTRTRPEAPPVPNGATAGATAGDSAAATAGDTAGDTARDTVGDGAALGPLDRAVLRQKAEELLASRDLAAADVTLTGGRAAVLRRREVPGTAGSGAAAGPDEGSEENGVVVEATLPGAAPGTAEPTVLLVGEPGVGRLALLARQRLELLYDASVGIGTTLDVARTAEELTKAAVPRFADFVAVDLPGAVLAGEEPADPREGLRRVALSTAREDSYLYPAGSAVSFVPSTPQARSLETGSPVLEPVLSEALGWIVNDPVRGRKILEAGIHSLMTVPMRARGVILGVVSFYRAAPSGPFEDDDLSLAEELVARAAVCIDNARRYTREHTMALALQRSLLPRGLPRQNAVEAASRYLPAQAGVGGDWFDVIPLSGARVALVVGDVVGHGVHAAATMGRLRTAVHNFAALDLPPEELLAHLDDLVCQLDEGCDDSGRLPGVGVAGATCLYAVHDPVARRCTLARAGHPLPAVVQPDGSVDFPDLPAGLPLGLGGSPFEAVDLELPEDSRLVLFTDGLVRQRGQDVDIGLGLLRDTLAGCSRRPPEEICDAVLDAMLPAGSHPGDDVALLVAGARSIDPARTAQWEIPADPAAVSVARADVIERLEEWELCDAAFVTELIVSELVTNAIRYGGDPIELRLILPQPPGGLGGAPTRTLICEVCDGSSTSPRLRRARTTDEGGRGLFLVAQLAQRWGTRYTAGGKVIWTEQPLA